MDATGCDLTHGAAKVTLSLESPMSLEMASPGPQGPPGAGGWGSGSNSPLIRGSQLKSTMAMTERIIFPKNWPLILDTSTPFPSPLPLTGPRGSPSLPLTLLTTLLSVPSCHYRRSSLRA